MQDDASIAVHGGLWVGPGRSTGRPSCQSCSTFKCEFYRKIRPKKFVQRQHQGPPLAPSLQGPGGAPLGHASRDQASSAGRGDGPWSLWTIQGTRARVPCRRRHWGPQAVGALGPRGCPSRGGPGLKMGSAGPVGSSVGVALPSESWIGVGRGRGRAPRVPARVLHLAHARPYPPPPAPAGAPRGGSGLKMGSAGAVGSSVGVARPSESWIGVGRDRGRAPRVPARVLHLAHMLRHSVLCQLGMP